MSMDLLPPEILDIILDHFQFMDLKALHLTCRRISRTAKPRLFEDYYLGFFSSSVTRFAELATKRPDIARHIKSFTLVLGCLPAFGEIEQWENLVDCRPPVSLFYRDYHQYECDACTSARDECCRRAWVKVYEGKRHSFGVSELVAGWTAYNDLLHDQRSWDDSHDQMLAEGISALPSLRAVKVDAIQLSDNNRKPIWYSMVRRALIGPDNWIYTMFNRGDRLRRQFKPQRALLRATLERGKRNDVSGLKELVLPDNQVPLPYGLQIPANGKSYPGLEFITDLDLFFTHIVSVAEDDEPESLRNSNRIFTELCWLLSSTPSVKRLRLVASEDSDAFPEAYDRFSQDFPRRLDPISWPSLERLSLGCEASADSLLIFLRRHASTLKSLHLIDLILLPGTGTWQDVIAQLPTFLHLDEYYFEGLLGDAEEIDGLFMSGTGQEDEYHYALDNFMLRGGPLPDLYAEGSGVVTGTANYVPVTC